MSGPSVRLVMTTRMRYPDMEDAKCDTNINILIRTCGIISQRHCQLFIIKHISHIAIHYQSHDPSTLLVQVH